VLQRVAEAVLTSQHRACDERLGPAGNGASGEQTGEPLASHDLGCLPCLVVGDDTAALRALGCSPRLGLGLGLLLGRVPGRRRVAPGRPVARVVGVVQACGVRIEAHPHRHIDLFGVGLVLFVLVPVFRLGPFDCHHDGCADDLRPCLLGDGLVVGGAEVGEGVSVQVGGDLLGVEHRQPLGPQALDLTL